ncbi:hypothetical protein [Coleofasciculus sp. FACHB-125]|uniref:hypothetical protein n=1 Tax=Coleofasciculus sp. FACHB-125 TaxID=2692784 RepID=UPI00168543DA|nr:hypothetical protein [Coleofasciculus sp. FACHB-125]
MEKFVEKPTVLSHLSSNAGVTQLALDLGIAVSCPKPHRTFPKRKRKTEDNSSYPHHGLWTTEQVMALLKLCDPKPLYLAKQQNRPHYQDGWAVRPTDKRNHWVLYSQALPYPQADCH